MRQRNRIFVFRHIYKIILEPNSEIPRLKAIGPGPKLFDELRINSNQDQKNLGNTGPGPNIENLGPEYKYRTGPRKN